ncbi:hypothetical protein ACFFJX_27625 [Pseudarcicella hirudinis]
MFKEFAFIFALLFVIGCLSTPEVKEKTQVVKKHPSAVKTTDIAQHVKKVLQIKKLREEIEQVNQNSFGVCDTCVTGYKAVLIENRLLANQLSEQNRKMKIAIDSNEAEIRKIQNLYSRNKKLRLEYEARYSYASQ